MSALAFAQEVEGFHDFIVCYGLVDADVTDVAEQGKVDLPCFVFLIMAHQGEQGRVVVAGDGRRSIVFMDEAHGLPHLLRGETFLQTRQV